MTFFLGLLISLAAGFFLIRLLIAQRLNLVLHILLAIGLGLGLDGVVAFYTHILFDQFNRFLPIVLVLLGVFLLSIQTYFEFIKQATKNSKRTKTKIPVKITEKMTLFWQSFKVDIRFSQEQAWGLMTLGILAAPLVISAHYFPLGGWDAWSCWNLKAKFIFLGHENWKDMLTPGLWRSNTHYPLLWPLINVWFWDLAGRFDQAVPMLNGIVIALLTAGILLFGLLELTGKLWPSILAAVMITALPFGVILYSSQYSDSLLGLYLLSAFTCFLLAEKYDLQRLKMLGMIFLGLMSFSKNEGLMAAVIVALALLWHERSRPKGLKNLLLAFLCAALPTIIFSVFFAPKNEAFINGLVSTDKPTHWDRVEVILAYPWLEFISGKWNCFWVLAFGGILLAGKRLWTSTLGMIGLSLVLYLGVVLAYYALNTYFEIIWWLGQTLSRILFALIPTVALWVGLGLTLSSPAKGEKIR